MDRSNISSTELIDAKLEEHQMCGSTQCPGCGHKLECKQAIQDWMGLPAGVKFDPTDQELIEHLEAKVRCEESKPHPLIDEFIPTIEGEDGICYTHPEKLPGVTRDGLSRHFFHRPSKAYTTGTRKRRKIQTECDLQGGETRWHKTGKTRPVMVNGKQKGCKKILVLYTNFGKHRKPEKTNWVMHQYHLGQHEEEREGELVVSKIFYQTQPRQCSWSDKSVERESVGVERERAKASCQASSSELAIEHVTKEGGHRDDMVSGFVAMDVQQMKANDHFSFAPFRKSFDEVGMCESSNVTESSTSLCNPGSCEERESSSGLSTTMAQAHMGHQQQVAYHISRPSNPISAIISPPPLHHQTTLVMDDSFHVSRLLFQGDKFQHQQQQHKIAERPGSHKISLDELFMDCTPSDMKEVSAMTSAQETEWLKYPFWQDPDNPDHHG